MTARLTLGVGLPISGAVGEIPDESIEAMNKTLAIFSGLPGTGKTTLAHLAAHKLRIPLLAIDDVVAAIPEHMSRHADPFWEDMVDILLNLVEFQLEQGFSVIVDSVFMGEDRRHPLCL